MSKYPISLSDVKSCNLNFTDAGTILRTIWNNQFVVTNYLSKDIAIISKNGDIDWRRGFSDSIARMATYQQYLVLAIGYDNQTLRFFDEKLRKSFEIPCPKKATKLHLNELIEWEDYIATTWFGAGEDSAFLAVYDKKKSKWCLKKSTLCDLFICVCDGNLVAYEFNYLKKKGNLMMFNSKCKQIWQSDSAISGKVCSFKDNIFVAGLTKKKSGVTIYSSKGETMGFIPQEFSGKTSLIKFSPKASDVTFLGIWKGDIVAANMFENIVFRSATKSVVGYLRTAHLELREFSVLGEYIMGVSKNGQVYFFSDVPATQLKTLPEVPKPQSSVISSTSPISSPISSPILSPISSPKSTKSELRDVNLEMTKTVRTLTGDGNVLATTWNDKVIVSQYLASDLQMVDATGTSSTKTKFVERGIAQLGVFKEFIVIVTGYSDQTISFYDKKFSLVFEVKATGAARNLKVDKIITWGDLFAVTWHAAGESPSLISGYNKRECLFQFETLCDVFADACDGNLVILEYNYLKKQGKLKMIDSKGKQLWNVKTVIEGRVCTWGDVIAVAGIPEESGKSGLYLYDPKNGNQVGFCAQYFSAYSVRYLSKWKEFVVATNLFEIIVFADTGKLSVVCFIKSEPYNLQQWGVFGDIIFGVSRESGKVHFFEERQAKSKSNVNLISFGSETQEKALISPSMPPPAKAVSSLPASPPPVADSFLGDLLASPILPPTSPFTPVKNKLSSTPPPTAFDSLLGDLFPDNSKESKKEVEIKNEPIRKGKSSNYIFTDIESSVDVVLDREKKQTPVSPKPETEIETQSYNDSFEGEWKISIQEKVELHAGVGFLMLDQVKYKQITDKINKDLANLSSYNVDKIELVVNPNHIRIFHGYIEQVERREKEEEFQPKLEIESNPSERKKVLEMVNELAVNVSHNRKTRIVKAWHGTSVAVAKKIMDLGFASLAKLDEGWFGKGIYFTSHPEYALRYCKPNECLIMCYLIITNPYPVIFDDATSTSNLKLYGKGNYKHYGCHYVPVIPYGPESSTMDFRPPQKGNPHKYDEIVIFQEGHILPKFIVYLAKKTPLNLLISSPSSWSTDEVVKFIQTLPLSQSYSTIIKEGHVNGAVLETMKTKNDWQELGVSVFGDLRILTAAVQKLFPN